MLLGGEEGVGEIGVAWSGLALAVADAEAIHEVARELGAVGGGEGGGGGRQEER